MFELSSTLRYHRKVHSTDPAALERFEADYGDVVLDVVGRLRAAIVTARLTNTSHPNEMHADDINIGSVIVQMAPTMYMPAPGALTNVGVVALTAVAIDPATYLALASGKGRLSHKQLFCPEWKTLALSRTFFACCAAFNNAIQSIDILKG